ncbi:hypothetical protein BGW39_003712 [Mortierella sp. 14UC]|nr:hypothetical protein BGW39_003712 [Mortierella sp. 14UC]
MTNLQYLYITDDTDVACSYKLPNVLNDRVIMAHLCWLIFLNPRLRWLDSYYDPVVDIPGCRLLAKAISGLSQLTTLEITIFCREELRFQVGAEIFFNCCPSIRKFKVVVDKPHYENRPQDWDLRDVGDTEWMVASRKEEPLTNLEDLELWEFRDSTSTENLLPVFAHCPNLKKLTILALSEHYNHDVIGRFIGKACPKLESLTFGSEDFETRVEVMESLPAQQVRDIYFQGVFDGSQASPHFSLAIQQHSKTLQTIQLTSTRDVTKISVAVILEECINLKVLIINGEDYNEDGSMCGLYATLSDLLERPWNAVKLTRLSLSVSVCDILIGPADPPVVLSEIKEAHSSRLEEMYQRAKALKDLRDMSLDVMVLTEDEYGELSFRAIEEPLARSEESEESEESDDDD